MINKADTTLLSLVRVAISSKTEDIEIDGNICWSDIYAEAQKQSVGALSFDGLDIICQSHPELFSGDDFARVKYNWIGNMVAMEQDYWKYKEIVSDLGREYAEHALPMMLLKGYGLSLYWPVPQHRPTGDIDIYLFEKWKDGDKVAKERFGTVVDLSHHHHSVFRYAGRLVENHYDFINTKSHRSARGIEARLKQMASEGRREILPNVYEPSPGLNVLYVLRHTACHFAAGNMNIRQWLDCILLIRSVHTEVKWDSFWKDVEMMGMTDFVLSVAYISEKYLNIDKSLFHIPQTFCIDIELAERVLQDILHPDFDGKEPSGGLKRIVWMCRRWWAHRWKHRIVYTDSLITTFWSQVIAHTIKPDIED